MHRKYIFKTLRDCFNDRHLNNLKMNVRTYYKDLCALLFFTYPNKKLSIKPRLVLIEIFLAILSHHVFFLRI